MTNSSMATADAFLCTGSTNYENGADLTGLNFGAAGTLVIAPASSAKGEFQSVIMFNLAAGMAQFNSAYGSNHWSITGVTLDLTSNYGMPAWRQTIRFFPLSAPGSLSSNGFPTTIGWKAPARPICPRRMAFVLTRYRRCWHRRAKFFARTFIRRRATTSTFSGRCRSRESGRGYLRRRRRDVSASMRRTIRLATCSTPTNMGAATSHYSKWWRRQCCCFLSANFTNHLFQLIGIGGDNGVYNVQVSTNPATTNWLTIGTVTASTNGAIRFVDTNAIVPQRFYRLSQ